MLLISWSTRPRDIVSRPHESNLGATVYGSDGIAGVVNYVLEDHFVGLELDARCSESIYWATRLTTYAWRRQRFFGWMRQYRRRLHNAVSGRCRTDNDIWAILGLAILCKAKLRDSVF